jgi:predicted TIM-barrel fold metal-dependent hydrolase
MQSRRDFLKSALSLAAVAALGGCQRRLVKPPVCAHFEQPHAGFVADAHCHIFNASDLQVGGFINQTQLKVPDTSPLNLIGDLIQELGWQLAPCADEELKWLRRAGNKEGTRPVLVAGQRSLAAQGGPPLDATIQDMGTNSDERYAEFWREVSRRDPARMQEFTRQVSALRLRSGFVAAGVEPRMLISTLQTAEGVRQQMLLEQRFARADSFNVITFLKPFFRFRTENAWSMLQMYGCDSQPGVDMICPAMVDFDLWLGDATVDDGRTHSHMDTQLAVMREIALATQGRVQGMAAFNPLRAACDGGDYLGGALAAIEQSGCIAFKMYPPMGFQATGNVNAPGELPACPPRHAGLITRPRLDQVLGDFFDMCADKDIPVMAHASESNGAGPGTAEMANPAFWADLLGGHAEAFLQGTSRLRISLGHMGGDHDIDKPSAWREQVAAMMTRFPGQVFADLSYYEHILGDAPTREALAGQMTMIDKDGVWQHVMYGSDWDMLGSVPGAERYVTAFNRFALDDLHLSEEQARAILGENAKSFYGLTPGGAGARRLEKFHGSKVKLPFGA